MSVIDVRHHSTISHRDFAPPGVTSLAQILNSQSDVPPNFNSKRITGQSRFDFGAAIRARMIQPVGHDRERILSGRRDSAAASRQRLD